MTDRNLTRAQAEADAIRNRLALAEYARQIRALCDGIEAHAERPETFALHDASIRHLFSLASDVAVASSALNRIAGVLRPFVDRDREIAAVVTAFRSVPDSGIEPEADVDVSEALRNPESFHWSYRIRGEVYTCRDWTEVEDVSRSLE